MAPLYEYYCKNCDETFEQITSSGDRSRGKCPKCNKKNTERRPPLFRVGGRGDLRESTLHGCHDHDVGYHQDFHSHDHDHSHDHKTEKKQKKRSTPRKKRKSA